MTALKGWRRLSLVLGFTSILLVATHTNPGEAAAEQRFTDLGGAKWATDGIGYLADRGTVAGYGAGRFKPLLSITRAQAVTYLVRELYPEASPTNQKSFTDVPKSHRFQREIRIASDMGLAGGFPDGSFRPDEPISRAETAAMLTRAYPLAAGNLQTKLLDVRDHWAAASIQRLASNGLVGGYPDGTFKPNRSVNRAEYAVFLSRVIQFKRTQAIEGENWDALLSLMTLEEKAGQMLMPDIRMWQNKPTTAINAGITSAVQDHKLGGLILFDKNIESTEQLTTFNHQLQALAGDIPLFLSIDQEGGSVGRIPGGTNLPGAMALGAVADSALSLEAGKVTGAELKTLGVNLNFAPVLDVNVNPDNPVIGIRSFGSEAGLVSELGTAFMKGLQQEGVIATAKHFPGHGDTDVDSHLGLPVVAHDRQRLEQIELRPFREAIKQGVDMIMIGHIAFPALDNATVVSKKDGSKVVLPATLSKKVITGLLKEEMGFQGVVVSDAFTMKAIAEHFGEEEAVVRAVSAGVDIVLMPKNITGAHDAIVQAVNEGELSSQQIDRSVKRILQLKQAYGLFEPSRSLQVKLEQAKRTVGSKSHLAVEREIAEKSVTVLKAEDGQLPHPVTTDRIIAVVASTSVQAQQIESQLKALGLPKQTSVKTVVQGELSREEIAQATSKADFVIVSSNLSRAAQGSYNWAGYQAIIDDLNTRSTRYVLLSLGNPYELLHLRGVKNAIAVYGAQEPNLTAGLRVILGQNEARGKLPVTLS